jgi:hypothetical protein
MKKTLSEITRKEWIIWHWIEVDEFGVPERNFECGPERTPTEAVQAAEEWDFLQSVKDAE